MNISTLPYYQLPEIPKEYTVGTVGSRMVDGLGFRYYWATEELRSRDFKYKPTNESWSIIEILEHICALTKVTLAIVEGKTIRYKERELFPFLEWRKVTLENIKKTSDILKKTKDLSEFTTKLIRNDDQISTYPFWNQVNGAIADALWHLGQVVSLRRSAGNPLPKGVHFFTGTIEKVE